MDRYKPLEIEAKWQKRWEKEKPFRAEIKKDQPKMFLAEMFPYPSGAGLHVGHVRNFTIVDVLTRFYTQQRLNVMRPFGYDTFGLPAENYAIKTGTAPQEVTATNIANFRKQAKRLGYAIDWDREINTSDPEYYKWTQWCFLQLFKKGLAYRKESYQWWCPVDQTVLANEQVENGKCWRCGHEVEKKKMKQWFFKITEYADELLDEIDALDWPEKIKTMQKNWIGRSEGAEISFQIDGMDEKVTVFTTRPDTLFGVTFLVLAPEHVLIEKIVSSDNAPKVKKYCSDAIKKTEIERQENKEKTGVFTGAYAINPINNEKIPIWVADYVLAGYGEGAIMAVPAHDTRDYEFAKKFDLPIRQVIEEVTGEPHDDAKKKDWGALGVVYDPETKKYLVLDWSKTDGRDQHLFSGGGNKDGETPEECARREIAEETGYVDLELITETPRILHRFYAANRGEYIEKEFYGFAFRLKSNKRIEQNLDADESFDIEWLSEEEVATKVHSELHVKTLEYYKNPGAIVGDGIMINSGDYDGLEHAIAGERIVAWLEKNHLGHNKSTYRMRDWLISRQRYWGCPIPIAYDKDGNAHAIPEEQLPVIIPEVDDYRPDNSGRSALAKAKDWLEVEIPVKDPKTGETHMEKMTRETDTLDGYACSSWYLWRYASPHDDKAAWDSDAINYWAPTDIYVGADHAVAHLLYIRFWCKFFADMGFLPFREPIKKLIYHGYINAPDGKKMSKSKGNVIDPLDVIDEGYGADTLRTYEMFIGPVELDASWDPRSVGGVYRFLNRCYNLVFSQQSESILSGTGSTRPVVTGESPLATSVVTSGAPREESFGLLKNTTLRNKTIKKVTEDIYKCSFNTAVACLMEYVNELYKTGASKKDLVALAKLLKPFAPHLASEMLEKLGADDEWPKWDDKYLVADKVVVVVQVNGKLRSKFEVDASDLDDEEIIIETAKSDKKLQKYIEGGVKKAIFVKKAKLVNLVV